MKRSNLTTILFSTTIALFLMTGFALSQTWETGSGILYVDPTTTNVGIGTTDLDGTPAIGKLTVKGSTSNGSTDILIGRDSSETNVFSVNTDGAISAFSLSASTSVFTESVTDDNYETLIHSIMYPTTTSSSTSYHIGSEMYVRSIVNTGITQSGYEMGLYLQSFRNANGASADDNGTLAKIIGQRIQYGHYYDNTSADPQTTDAYGITIIPYCLTGDIINMYDIYLGSGGVSSGTITNRYGIYQVSTAAKNYFAGNVGIGTTSPQSKLAVNGTITTKEVNVTETGWSDFVFEDDYNLPSLDHVETFIKQNKHLPDIPSAEEIEANGLPMAEMMAKQIQKIEELTLYVIQLQKKNIELEKRLVVVEQGK